MEKIMGLCLLLFPEGRLWNLFNQLTRCLTKTVKPKLETSTFWCLQGFSPNFLKKEVHCYLEQRGEGDTHPELLGKGEGEAEG
jgi:hypothetical protein